MSVSQTIPFPSKAEFRYENPSRHPARDLPRISCSRTVDAQVKAKDKAKVFQFENNFEEELVQQVIKQGKQQVIKQERFIQGKKEHSASR